MKILTLLCAMVIAASASATVREERFYGYAFDLKTGKYLYAELHDHHFDGNRWLNGRIRYVAADGRDLGDKSLDFSSDPYIPVYRLDLSGGYAEGISNVTSTEISAYRRETAGAEPQAERIGLKAKPVAADSGFNSLVCDHFNALASGETIDFTFVAAGKLDGYRFRVRRAGDGVFDNKPAIRLQAEPSTLLQWFVDPLVLLYDRDRCRLLEYQGVSNIHDPVTGKPWTVRIDYFTQRPAGVPPPPPLE